MGTIPYSRHGELAEAPRSVCIARHAGKWWLSFNFTQEMEIEDGPLTEQKLINLYGSMAKDDLAKIACGFDRGVADSNSAHYDFDPVAKRRMETREKNRRRYQRKYARQNPGSKRSRKTRKRIESTYAYQADVRKEFAHKTSRKIVDSEAKVFVFEDLKIRNMTRRPRAKRDEAGRFVKNGAAAKAGLNRSILGSGWGKLNL